MVEKMGVLNISLILIGSVFILGDVAFLWFLWAGNENNSSWRWIVLQGHLQTTVTLSSAVLRTIVGVQSTLCTSMIAGSIMELSGFNWLHAASLSIQRFSGGHPYHLMKNGIFNGRIWYLLATTALLTLTTIASHLISTGLVSDLQITTMFGDPVVGEAAYSLNFTKTALLSGNEPDLTQNMPSTYAAFGEFSEDFVQSDGVDDTGPTVRAFLPITSPTIRQTLSNYTGLGTILNSHVVCIKPQIKDVVIGASQGSISSNALFLTGSVSLGSSIPPGLSFFKYPWINNLSQPFNWVNFSCSLAVTQTTNDWPISMCTAGNGYGDLKATEDNTGADGGRHGILGLRATSLLHEDLLFDPLSYIVVNYSRYLLPSEMKANITWTDISLNDSSWRALRNMDTNPIFPQTVSISYCFTDFGSVDTNITVHSSTNRTEPVLQSLQNTLALDARQVLLQLGADGSNRSLSERGVLSLQHSTTWSTIFPDEDNAATAAGSTWVQALDGSYGFGMLPSGTPSSPIKTTWALCTNCGYSARSINSDATSISAALGSIFQSSIRASGSTAKALQAILTIVNMMQYYERLQQFDVSATTHTTFMEQQLQPVHRSGLIIVTISLILHLSLVAIIVTVFISSTKLSFVGHSWYTVAQLQSDNLLPILDEASLMRNEEVEAWVLENEPKKDRMILAGEEGKYEARVVKRHRSTNENLRS
ncbi:hypothetical protein DL98DRAFT_611049 [Cadophora sp. DSE1049]|nr:hypothetical protein DL98DRAFT_611049 [Cadophora sp. DSE1049]